MKMHVSMSALIACVTLGLPPRIDAMSINVDDCVGSFLQRNSELRPGRLSVAEGRSEEINRVLVSPKRVRVKNFSNYVLGTAYHIYLIVEINPNEFEVAASPIVPFSVSEEVARSGTMAEHYFVDHLALLDTLETELGVEKGSLRTKVVGTGSILSFDENVRRIDNRSGHTKGDTSSLVLSVEVLRQKGLKLSDARTVVWDYSAETGNPLHTKELKLAEMTINNHSKAYLRSHMSAIKENYRRLIRRFARANGTYDEDASVRFYEAHTIRIQDRLKSLVGPNGPELVLFEALVMYLFMDMAGFEFTFSKILGGHETTPEEEIEKLTLHQSVMDVFLQVLDESEPLPN